MLSCFHDNYPCLCLCLGFLHITTKRFFRLTVWQSLQIGLTDALTFINYDKKKKPYYLGKCKRYLITIDNSAFG